MLGCCINGCRQLDCVVAEKCMAGILVGFSTTESTQPARLHPHAFQRADQRTASTCLGSSDSANQRTCGRPASQPRSGPCARSRVTSPPTGEPLAAPLRKRSVLKAISSASAWQNGMAYHLQCLGKQMCTVLTAAGPWFRRQENQIDNAMSGTLPLFESYHVCDHSLKFHWVLMVGLSPHRM